MYLRQRGEKNGKPVWSLRFEKPDPGTGKRAYVYETFHGSKREAERRWIVREAEIKRAGAGYAAPSKQTLAAYLRAWLRDQEPNWKRTTLASYRTHVELHIIPALGAVPLSGLTPPQVAAWQADMLRKPGRRGNALSPKRVLNAYRALHTAMEEAVRLELIPSNPVGKVRPPRQAPEEVVALDADQVSALMATVAGHRLEAMFAAAWQTGLRMGELLGLRWEDVDLGGATLRVAQGVASTGGPAFVQAPKSKLSARTIALPAAVTAALQARRERQTEERQKAGGRWRDHGLVFPTSRGTPVLPSSMERTWYTVRDRAGLPAYGFHCLRHTYASMALSAGVPLELVSENLGHAGPGFTKRVYAKYLLDAKRAGADIMDEVARRMKAAGAVDE